MNRLSTLTIQINGCVISSYALGQLALENGQVLNENRFTILDSTRFMVVEEMVNAASL